MKKSDKIEVNFMTCAICGKPACGYLEIDDDITEIQGRLYYCREHINGGRLL